MCTRTEYTQQLGDTIGNIKYIDFKLQKKFQTFKFSFLLKSKFSHLLSLKIVAGFSPQESNSNFAIFMHDRGQKVIC